MGFKLSKESFDGYLAELAKHYDIYAPIRKEGKASFSDQDVIGYGKISTLADLVIQEKSYFSPKEIFYPIRETLFYFNKQEIVEPKLETKPVVIFLRPCDINGIERLDQIFLKNGDQEDFYYKRRRERVKFMMMACSEGFDTCFCVSMGANQTTAYDGAVAFGEEIELDIKDKALLTPQLEALSQADVHMPYVKENKMKVVVPAVSQLEASIFEHPLWKEYTARCVACGRCNTSCITCSCFTMQDVALSDDKTIGERRRVWAGCHVDGFTDMAGGHAFRKPNGDRMRFKAMHKINDFHKRFGKHMCVGCGRCEDVCPEYISFAKCIHKINQIIEEGAVSE